MDYYCHIFKQFKRRIILHVVRKNVTISLRTKFHLPDPADYYHQKQKS
jgi:hypothetical protein